LLALHFFDRVDGIDPKVPEQEVDLLLKPDHATLIEEWSTKGDPRTARLFVTDELSAAGARDQLDGVS
jgi:hypothetical protein